LGKRNTLTFIRPGLLSDPIIHTSSQVEPRAWFPPPRLAKPNTQPWPPAENPNLFNTGLYHVDKGMRLILPHLILDFVGSLLPVLIPTAGVYAIPTRILTL